MGVLEHPEPPVADGLDDHQLRQVLGALGEGITVQGPDGRLVWANQAAAELCGYPNPEALLAASPDELAARFRFYDESGQPLPADRLPGRRALRGEHPPEALLRWTGTSGKERWSLITASPVCGGPGGAPLVVNLFRDVTERQRTLEELRASERLLAQRFAEQADAVGVLIQALLPAELPRIDGLAFAHRYLAADGDIGGDFFDAVPLRDGRRLLTIADVAGKGARAASLTASTRHSLRTLARRHTRIGELFEDLNAVLAEDFPEGSFCSAASVALQRSGDGFEATAVVAGHPKPVVLRATGSMEAVGVTGLPLGIEPLLGATETAVRLLPGDTLVMYTDGCVGEGADPIQVLAPLAESAAQPAEKIAQRVMEISSLVQPGHPDDRALLVAEVLPG